MFLVQKANLANLSSHFRSTAKKPSQVPKTYQLAARSFDEKVILHLNHLQKLDLTENSSNISLSWLSAAVSMLSAVHTEAEDQISNLKSEADDYQALYMDYSVKVLDLCNLISSAVHRLTDRRLLMNFSLRLLNFADTVPSHEKLNKARDALARSVSDAEKPAPATEKGLRAKVLMEELTVMLGKLPRGSTSGGRDRDLIRRTFYALGLLTLLVGSVLVTVMFGETETETDAGKLRVPAEFLWSDSVNGLQNQIVDRNAVLEVEKVSTQALVVCDLLQSVGSNGGDDGDDNGDGRVRLEAGVKELVSSVKTFSDGIDGLTNGVNGLFRTVLKTRNGRLDI